MMVFRTQDNPVRRLPRHLRNEDLPTDTFTPRTYQVELLHSALQQNTIVCMGSSAGKTFIAVMLIKEMAHNIRQPIKDGGKCNVLLVNSECLVEQQAQVITHHTDLVVGQFTSSIGTDNWSHDKWLQEINQCQCVVTTPEIFIKLLRSSIIIFPNISLLILDECHHVLEDHPYNELMKRIDAYPKPEQPRLLGLTASVLSSKIQNPSELESAILLLEEKLHSKAETFTLVISERYGIKPKELVIECDDYVDRTGVYEEIEEILEHALYFLEECILGPTEELDNRDPRQIAKTALNECLNILRILGPWCAACLADMLIGQIEKIDKNKEFVPLHKKFLRFGASQLRMVSKHFEKKFQETEYHIDELLQYTTPKVKKFVEVLRTYRPDTDFIIISEEIDEMDMENHSDLSDDSDFSQTDEEDVDDDNILKSPKHIHVAVKKLPTNEDKLFDPLNSEQDKYLCGVVFVDHPYVAYTLNKLIEEICAWDEQLCFVRSSHITKQNTKGSAKGSGALRKQEKVLRKFRMQELNLLVSTNAVQEGIDIPKCNLIVLFDPPKDYRSYSQSKGRARARDAEFLMLVEEEHIDEFKEDLKMYKGLEKVLIGREKQKEEMANVELTSDIDNLLPPYATSTDSDASRVTLSSAIMLVNKYCAKLPSDTFTHLTPACVIQTISKGNSMAYCAKLRLPINSPIKQEVKGVPMQTEVLAKKAVALKMCEILHQRGELDDKLMPVGKEMFQHEEEEFEWEDEEDPNSQILPGTTKRKQYYCRKVASALVQSHCQANSLCYLYLIKMVLTGAITEEQNTRGRRICAPEETTCCFGFVTSKRIPSIPSFPVYTRSGEVTVSIDLLCSDLILKEEELKKLQYFHMFLFSNVLHLEKDPMEFCPEKALQGYLLLPLNTNRDSSLLKIDWNFVHKVEESPFIRKAPRGKNVTVPFIFNEEDFEDAVVMPSYRNIDQPQHFYVAEIRKDLNPNSPFPSPELYKTFYEYYTSKYGLEISNREQSLLDVDHTSARLNLLIPRYMNQKGVALPTSSAETKKARRENLQQKQILVPELCDIHVFPASLWRKAVCLPAVLYRMNYLLIAEEIRVNVAKETKIGVAELPEGFCFPKLNFGFDTNPENLKKSGEEVEDQELTSGEDEKEEKKGAKSFTDATKYEGINAAVAGNKDASTSTPTKHEGINAAVAGNKDASTSTPTKHEGINAAVAGNKDASTSTPTKHEDANGTTAIRIHGESTSLDNNIEISLSSEEATNYNVVTKNEDIIYTSITAVNDTKMDKTLAAIKITDLVDVDSSRNHDTTTGSKDDKTRKNEYCVTKDHGNCCAETCLAQVQHVRETKTHVEESITSVSTTSRPVKVNHLALEEKSWHRSSCESDHVKNNLEFTNDVFCYLRTCDSSDLDTSITLIPNSSIESHLSVVRDIHPSFQIDYTGLSSSLQEDTFAKDENLLAGKEMDVEITIIRHDTEMRNFINTSDQNNQHSFMALVEDGKFSGNTEEKDKTEALVRNCIQDDAQDCQISDCANQTQHQVSDTVQNCCDPLKMNKLEKESMVVINGSSDKEKESYVSDAEYMLIKADSDMHGRKRHNSDDLKGMTENMNDKMIDSVSTKFSGKNGCVNMFSSQGKSPNKEHADYISSAHANEKDMKMEHNLENDEIKSNSTQSHYNYVNIHEAKMVLKPGLNIDLEVTEDSDVKVNFDPNVKVISPLLQESDIGVNANSDVRIILQNSDQSALSKVDVFKDVGYFTTVSKNKGMDSKADDSVREPGIVISLDKDIDLSTFVGPNPCLILQALTMSNANDFFSLERLETIGDSFLKYAITVYLYCTYPGIHEGKLSYLRSKQVSNYNLYRLGKRKGLGECIISSKFEPHENWLPPGFIINEDKRKGPVPKVLVVPQTSSGSITVAPSSSPETECQSVKEKDAMKTKCSSNGSLVNTEFTKFNKEMKEIDEEIDEEVESEEYTETTLELQPYSLQVHHSIPDKSIADCMESLTGCYLTSCGKMAALQFMSWLGLRVLPRRENLNENQQGPYELGFDMLPSPPSPLLTDVPDAESKLMYLLDGYSALEERIGYIFKDKSYLLQAFTHASYHYNTITDCYQRLEFLGDAILDYVITRHLYEDSCKYSPGVLTDLRSALVNNNIFAALAVKWDLHKYFRAISPSLFHVIDKFVARQKEKEDEIDIEEEEEGEEESEDQAQERVELEVPKALGDIFESLAGAIYLDSGMSLDAVWRVYYRIMNKQIDKYLKSIPKSPVRELLEMEPETAKFQKPERTLDGKMRVAVNVVGKGVFTGIGRNYRIAKSAAAKKALRCIKTLKEQGLI
ncbi:hypothetical protein CHS0354_040114 [Potamilus streckersoni]|uniref:ribonuclease III n=2 Tax=Potamilus streckersoni TaxID=2493646 RepID=A0AAE0W181_9BIVA|nr:hypothetical protein CHS0354_040114 [Potamilus streckersoni]